MSELAVQDIKSRLPMPAGVTDLSSGQWRVLCESVFPSARTPEAIIMALDYCRVRKLDIFKKPVHIVPMWSTGLKKEVETVWPGISEIQITASRTGAYAGMDEPKWGETITREFKGIKGNNVGETVIKLDFPEWCSVTVYRMVDGQKCAFTEPVYWLEAYGRIGKTELPNDQWAKRTRGMIIKVAKAFSLRAAFPEEGEHTAEEMEGRILEEVDGNGIVIDNTAPLKKSSPFKNASMRKTWGENVEKAFKDAHTTDELEELLELYKPKFLEMEEAKQDYDLMELDRLRILYKQCWNRIVIASRETPEEEMPENELDESFNNMEM